MDHHRVSHISLNESVTIPTTCNNSPQTLVGGFNPFDFFCQFGSFPQLGWSIKKMKKSIETPT